MSQKFQHPAFILSLCIGLTLAMGHSSTINRKVLKKYTSTRCWLQQLKAIKTPNMAMGHSSTINRKVLKKHTSTRCWLQQLKAIKTPNMALIHINFT